MSRIIDADALMKDVCDSLNQMTNIGIAVDGDWLWAKLNDAIDNAPIIKSAQQWIPCSERLPEPLQEVIVTSTQGHVYTSRIAHGNFEYGGDVVAWMSLPEPYKGGVE